MVPLAPSSQLLDSQAVPGGFLNLGPEGLAEVQRGVHLGQLLVPNEVAGLCG